MSATPALLDLIDTYAAAAAARDLAYRECASWAFLAADDAMTAARSAVADALGGIRHHCNDEPTPAG